MTIKAIHPRFTLWLPSFGRETGHNSGFREAMKAVLIRSPRLSRLARIRDGFQAKGKKIAAFRPLFLLASALDQGLTGRSPPELVAARIPSRMAIMASSGMNHPPRIALASSISALLRAACVATGADEAEVAA